LAADARGLQKTTVAALAQHGSIVEYEGCLIIVWPQATNVTAAACFEVCAKIIQLLAEARDESAPE
jgi:hypothetical protein